MTLSHPTRREFFTYVGAVSAAPVFRAQAKDAHRWDASFDVVIVGSGAAGLSAVLSAHEAGCRSILILEKMSFAGGASRISCGYFNAVDPQRQRAMHIEDSLELFEAQTIKSSHGKGSKELIHILCSQALDCLHWLEGYGVRYADNCSQIYGGMFPRGHIPLVQNPNESYIDILVERCLERGIEIQYSQSADEIIAENNCVLGVKTSNTSGPSGKKAKTRFIRARKALILASGGFAANAALVRGFVSEIRTQSAKAGLDPTSFLEPMPTGENDEEYSKYRLNRMKMKRIAEQVKVESWAQKNHVEAKPGAVSYRRIGRNEAMARVAAVFEPDPLKQGELYSKLARTSQVSDSNLMLQSQRLGVPGQQVLAQLNNSEQQAENIEYTTVQEVFGVKKVKTKKKKSKKAVQAQRRAQAEAERRNQREEERILRKQKQLMAREEAKRKREALIAEREAKKARLREERHATPFSRGNSQIDGPQTAPSAPNPEASKPAPAPQDLVSKDEEASLKLQEIFRKTEDWEIKRNDVWKPDSIKSPKPAANDAKSEAEPEDIFDKIKKIVPLSSRSDRKFPFYLALIERIIPKAHAEEFPDSPAPGIKENVSSSSGLSSDMEIFRLQSEQFHKLKETVETIDLKQRAEEILNDSTLRKAVESIAVREKKPVEAKETISENVALPDEQTRWLTTFFISESMGEDNIKALLEAYAGDNTIRFVLKGFNGKGTINDGLKWLLSLAMAFEPQPNILIDPELYERFSVSVVPTMLLERIDGVPVEQQSAMEKKIGKTLSNLGYALGLTKDKSQSLADRLVSQNGAVSALKRSPALIVSGVTSRQWAVEKARTGADFRQGVQGEVFDIVERDIKEIAKERLAKIDWERKKEEALSRFWTQQEKNFIDLPLVEHESERTVDPTITLNRNIYGEDGTVIFKEGQRFNPFDAMPFTHTVVVFNAAQPKQLEAVEQIVREAREKNTPVMLLATEFKSSKVLEQIQDLNKSWKESVFLLTPELKERFQIRATPTVVRADNERKVFYVREIPAL